MVDKMRESTEVENQMILENRYTLASDPTKTFVQPMAKEAVPYLTLLCHNNFTDIQRDSYL